MRTVLLATDADWIADGRAMAEFDRGARLAAAAIARLGAVQLEDITILLADDFPPREGERFSDIAGHAECADGSHPGGHVGGLYLPRRHRHDGRAFP